MADVKFYKGSAASYGALTKDQYTFYLVDSKDLYLGAIKLSNGEDLAAAIARITTNESDIEKLQADLNALVGGESGSISDMIDEAITAAKTELREEIAANTAAIEEEVQRAEGAESTLQANINAANQKTDNLETKVDEIKEATDGTISGLDARLKTAEGTIVDHTNQINAAVEEIGRVEEELGGNIAAVDNRLDVLVGEDTAEGTTIRGIAAEETAKIVAGADEKYDTLKEIADFIMNDTTGAAGMANDIKANTDAINTLDSRMDGVEEVNTTQSADITDLKQKVATNTQNITTNTQSIAAINDSTNGILAQSKGYTDNKIAEVNQTIQTNQNQVTNELASANEKIDANTQAIAAINNETSGILAQAKAEISTLRNSLGSAAYEDKEAFDAAGSAATAETNANLYTDGKINEVNTEINNIKTVLTWQDI